MKVWGITMMLMEMKTMDLIDGPSIVLEPRPVEEVEGLVVKTGVVFEGWITKSPTFGDHLFDEVKPLVVNKRTAKVAPSKRVSKFNTTKYYRQSGNKQYPAITLLARICFLTVFNSAFQETSF